MNTIEKIKNKIKATNKKKNNICYYVSISILIAIGFFVFITMILQTNWFGIKELSVPILVWIISQPLVGVFFLPFIFLLSYVCWFIISVGKPVTLKQVLSDLRTLYENEEITKQEYEETFKNLTEASQRKELEKIKQKEMIGDVVSDV